MRLYKTLMSEMLVYCFVVVVLTGAFLAFFYPSSGQTFYDGPYEPLRGAEVSAAYAAEVEIAFEAPGGRLMRQLHQWSSLLFLVGIVLPSLGARSSMPRPLGGEQGSRFAVGVTPSIRGRCRTAPRRRRSP
ncbi:hypothetical protein ACFSKW_06455 [Nonomuraea mangrovi]|uniref:Cytochrome bc1 complex cytochrome b subunit n=1 Tax=Nonomuraea mangrovi TaxID=2316207 RepID=A0ABW4SNY0_9ACTN